MGILSTALLGFSLIAPGYAQEGEPALHPVLGKRPPREVLNKDILELSREEGAAWVHGAVAQMAQVLARYDPEAGKCVMDWFFETGDGAEAVPQWMKQLPDKNPTTTIMAAAKKACPTL